MRKLNTKDVFKMGRIIKAANMKEEIIKASKAGAEVSKGIPKDVPEEERKALLYEAQQEMGIEIFLTVLENCSSAQMEEKFYDLLSGVFEMSEKDIENMSLDALIENFKKVMQENNIQNFLNAAVKLN